MYAYLRAYIHAITVASATIAIDLEDVPFMVLIKVEQLLGQQPQAVRNFILQHATSTLTYWVEYLDGATYEIEHPHGYEGRPMAHARDLVRYWAWLSSREEF